jgi:hypothetical protein
MPGTATQFEILRLTVERLEAANAMPEITQVIRNNEQYAYLGAIGPALGDFIPSDPPPDPTNDPNPYALVWKMIFGFIGGKPGFYDALTRMRAIMEKMEKIANDEDIDALCAIKDSGEYEEIENAAKDFQTLVMALEGQALNIANIIGGQMKPNVCTTNVTDPVPQPQTWQIRDFLHWKRPGRFIEKLLDEAKNTGDDRLRAYAYGYLVSYAGNVCGNAFVNSAVGGPSRTQWWRQRFVKNYVDAWSYGFYRVHPVMTGDTPNPDYDDPAWPNLCDAQFQDKISFGAVDPVDLMGRVKTAQAFPKVLPDDFAQRWFNAFSNAYGAPLPNNLPSADVLNAAYLMNWLVLWLQTSGEVLGCDLTEPMTPPDDCGADPSPLDPFVPDESGGPSLPPSPSIDYDTDVGAIVCGIILAILGGAAFFAGAGALGGAVFVAGISMLDCESVVEPDWKSLRCQLYWYRKYLNNGLRGMHKLLALTGFGFPHAAYLKVDTDTLQLLPLEFESGKNLVKSRITERLYPSKPWDGQLLGFNQRPTSTSPGFEKPGAVGCRSEVYPSFWVDDDAANPLTNGDIKTAGVFPFRPEMPGSNEPVQFGNAVANAIDLLQHLSKGFPDPDWNLDADRGLAYVTWQFKGFYDPDNVAIEPEP